MSPGTGELVASAVSRHHFHFRGRGELNTQPRLKKTKKRLNACVFVRLVYENITSPYPANLLNGDNEAWFLWTTVEVDDNLLLERQRLLSASLKTDNFCKGLAGGGLSHPSLGKPIKTEM